MNIYKIINKFMHLFGAHIPYFGIFGIDDAAAVGIGSALVGAVGNLFGGKKKKNYTLDDLKQYGYKPYDAAAKKKELMRISGQMLQQRRNLANQKASSLGLDPVQSSFTNEADVHDSLLSGIAQIEDEETKYNNAWAEKLLMINESQPEDESTISKLVEGAFTGADLGLKFGSVLGHSNKNPADPGNLPGTVPTTIPPVGNTVAPQYDPATTTMIGSEPTGLSSNNPFGIKKFSDAGINNYGNSNIAKLLGSMKKHQPFQYPVGIKQ